MNKKKMKIGIVAVIFVVALVVVLAITKKELQLPKLEVEDISKVYMWGEKPEMVNLDIEEFLRYYNKIDELRNNKEGAGTTPNSAIVIELNNGEEISIYNSGDQFEVSFKEGDDRFQYWGKQQGIDNMLEHGVYGLD